MSALPSTADLYQGDGYVSFVPNCDIGCGGGSKKKPPEGGSQLNLVMVDQAAINAGSDFRRQAMKP